MEIILLILEILYLLLSIITMILFRKEILIISNVRPRFQNFYERHKIWFHIIYSLGWPIPWILAISELLKMKFKKKTIILLFYRRDFISLLFCVIRVNKLIVNIKELVILWVIKI